jgi:TonB family protein
MNLRFMSICVLVAISVAYGPVVESMAQNAGGADASQGEVVMTKLVAPVYPPLARQALRMGEVELTISVRPDGSVASAEVVSGDPLLTQAAMDSTQQSSFECRKCSAAKTSYPLVYTFQLEDFTGRGLAVRACKSASDAQQFGGSLVIESQNHVTLVADPGCVFVDRDDVFTKVRSLKCLYLWQCGRRNR